MSRHNNIPTNPAPDTLSALKDLEQALSPPGNALNAARRDPVTAMLPRKAFLSRLEQEVALALVQHRPLALALFEVSNMSGMGKREVQTLLRTLASRLWDSAQTEDTLGRLEDNSLAFILPGSGPFHALALAESIVNDVWSACVDLGQENFPLRASVVSSGKEDQARSPVDSLGTEMLEKARRVLKQASSLPDAPVRDRVRLSRRDEEPEERQTLVLANEKQFLFFGGI